MSLLTVTLQDKHEVSRNTFELTFIADDSTEIRCNPGQYIWLILPQLTYPDEKGNRRAFSLSSVNPDTRHFSILFRGGISGFKKTLLELPIGAKLQITAPLGTNFLLSDLPNKHVFLIAGGVGISPFLSVLRSGKSFQALSKKIVFINTGPERAFLLEDIQQLTTQQNIQFVHHIGAFEQSLLDGCDLQNTEFYVSGSKELVQAVYSTLISLGVTLTHMHFEQYYPQLTTQIHQYFDQIVMDTNIGIDKPFFSQESFKNPFKMLVDSTSSHLIVTDENGFIVYANKAAESITGYSFTEMKGNTPRLWGGLMDHDFYVRMWNRIKLDKKPFTGEIKNRRKNGEIYYALGRITPILENEQVIGFIASEEEITQRVLLEQETLKQKNDLAVALERDEAMLNSIGEGVIAHDEQKKVLLANDAAIRMLGYSREELIGKAFIDIVKAETEAGEPIANEDRPFEKVANSTQIQTNTIVYLRKDGSKFTTQVTNSPVIVGEKMKGIIQVFRDITQERKVDSLKTEFISLASHQLRTPLSTINWYLEMVLNGDAGQISDEQKQFVNEAYKGAGRMVDLVNALLNVARIEAGTFMVDPVPVHIVQIARSVLDELKMQIDDKKQFVSLEKEDLPEIPLDVQLTRIIFQNLLTNAVKYTQEGGVIKVYLKKLATGTQIGQNLYLEEDHFLIQVTDNGVGIPTNDRKHIFDKLYRATNVMKSDTEGTGLGLYIIKSIVDQSNGYIWFDSQEGKGTSFFVVLPLSGMVKKSGSRKIESLGH